MIHEVQIGHIYKSEVPSAIKNCLYVFVTFSTQMSISYYYLDDPSIEFKISPINAQHVWSYLDET